MIIIEGHDISYSTIAIKINEKLNKNKKCFIRQSYDLGDRLEYDFGEIKILINGVSDKYYLAVVSSPEADFRWNSYTKTKRKKLLWTLMLEYLKWFGDVYGG